jgi:hypothetical protein
MRSHSPGADVLLALLLLLLLLLLRACRVLARW